MNDQEFRRWLDDYTGKFPSVHKWLNQLPGEIRSNLLRMWESILAGVAFRDAIRITLQMARGDLEPIAPYDSDRERTAVYIKRAVEDQKQRSAGGHRKREPQKFPLANEDVVVGMSFGDLMQRVEHLEKSGRSRREAIKEVIREQPKISDDNAPRFNCLLCLDSGLVQVWSEISMKAALQRTDLLISDQRYRRAMVAPCRCKPGLDRIWCRDDPPPKQWHGWRSKEAMYDPDKHCLVHDGDIESDTALDDLVAWVRRVAKDHGVPTQQKPGELF